MKPTTLPRPVAFAILVLCSLVCCSMAKDQKVHLSDVKKFDECVYKSVFSFAMPAYYPPTNEEELKKTCQRNSDGFKCLREQTKGAPPIIKRGLLTMVGTRQRQNRKLCQDPETGRRFTAAAKCVFEKSHREMEEVDRELQRRVGAILQRNYNDSGPELKQICCALHNLRKSYREITEKSCPNHRAGMDDIVSAIVTDDIRIICEEDEKLASTCLKLEKLPFDPKMGLQSGVSLTLYLVATLGEQDDTLGKLE